MTSRPIALLSLIFFLLSLALPAVRCDGGITVPGYEILIKGWLGIFILDPRWLANVALLFLIFNSAVRQKLMLKTGAFALLAAIFSFAPSVSCPGSGGAPGMSVGISIGAWAWMCAMVLGALANFTTSAVADTHEVTSGTNWKDTQ